MSEKQIVTDLVLEAHEILKENMVKSESTAGDYEDGIKVENAGDENIKITRVRVVTPAGEQKINKSMGNYLTLEIPGLRQNDKDLYENSCRALADELTGLLKLNDKSTIMVVGLGNWNVTPDALGPRVIDRIMITRHMIQLAPDQVQEGLRAVCAVSPGVMGITGIETGEIIKGIIDKVKPDVLIAIDALASRKLDRVNTTIQIADTGISPGSGVGNKRMELSKETLGIPVIAIGVPTVVDAATIANDAIDLVIDSMIEQASGNKQVYVTLKEMDREEKYALLKQLMDPYVGNLIVTPKEVDEVVDRISRVIANGLNMSLHESVGMKHVDRFLN